MIHTKQFRMYPTEAQERRFHEIFTIYNRMKRIGYKLAFEMVTQRVDQKEETTKKSKEELQKERSEEKLRIHNTLMVICDNNLYVNTIINDIFQKLDEQETWLEK